MEIKPARPYRVSNILVVLALWLAPLPSSAAELPAEFTAHYALEIFGTVMARAKYTLEHNENGLSMTQSTRPAGIVALLRDDKIDVRSDMIIRNGQILLTHYDYRHTGDDKDRDVSFKIDWKSDPEDALTGKVTGSYAGATVDIDIDKPVWDPLSIQVPIMVDAKQNLPPHEHGLFMQGEVKDYLFQNLGTERISANGQDFQAIKIVGKETRRDRAMYVWLVRELNNLPVKIEQWKEGKLKSTVVLEKVSFSNSDETLTVDFTDTSDDYE